MYRLGFVLILGFLVSCKSGPAAEQSEDGFSYKSFSSLFKESRLPMQVADTSLLSNRDTAQVRDPQFARYIPDSIKNRIFSKGSRVRYYAVSRFEVPEGESYYFVKGVSNSKRAMLMVAFDKDGSFGAAFPFLVPDSDPATTQVSTMDRNYNIARNVTTRKGNELLGEGKEVYVYNSAAKQFSLIQIDVLDEKNQELINPIDTLPKTRRFAGDYVKGKRNIVSIRDGRTPSQALAFVHLEMNEGDCIGELKGELLFTSSTTAIYRQGGDPCVLQFTFSGNSVTLKEEQGCGNHRGIDCALEGSYTRKKEIKPKSSKKAGKK